MKSSTVLPQLQLHVMLAPAGAAGEQFQAPHPARAFWRVDVWGQHGVQHIHMAVVRLMPCAQDVRVLNGPRPRLAQDLPHVAVEVGEGEAVGQLARGDGRLDDVVLDQFVQHLRIHEVRHRPALLFHQDFKGQIRRRPHRPRSGLAVTVVDEHLETQIILKAQLLDGQPQDAVLLALLNPAHDVLRRQALRRKHRIQHVHHAVVCDVIACNHLGPVHKRALVVDDDRQGLSLQRLQGHAICQIFRHEHAWHHMVLHDFREIRDVQHVELAQIHEVHDVGHRLVGRGEQRVRVRLVNTSGTNASNA